MLLREARPIAARACIALHVGPRGRGLRLLRRRCTSCRRTRAAALAARDGLRQHQGRALDGRGARAARRPAVPRAAGRDRLRRDVRHAGHAGAAVPRFLTWLGVAGSGRGRDRRQCRARADRRAPRPRPSSTRCSRTGLISRHEHAERRAAFQRDIIDAEKSLRRTGEDTRRPRRAPAVLAAQKAALLDAARRGLITDRTAARQVAALDEHILRVTLAHHEDGDA